MRRFTIIHGQCLSVGVGGYLLGGGVNALGATARHGFGAEQVIKMKVSDKKVTLQNCEHDDIITGSVS